VTAHLKASNQLIQLALACLQLLQEWSLGVISLLCCNENLNLSNSRLSSTLLIHLLRCQAQLCSGSSSGGGGDDSICESLMHNIQQKKVPRNTQVGRRTCCLGRGAKEQASTPLAGSARDSSPLASQRGPHPSKSPSHSCQCAWPTQTRAAWHRRMGSAGGMPPRGGERAAAVAHAWQECPEQQRAFLGTTGQHARLQVMYHFLQSYESTDAVEIAQPSAERGGVTCLAGRSALRLDLARSALVSGFQIQAWPRRNAGVGLRHSCTKQRVAAAGRGSQASPDVNCTFPKQQTPQQALYSIRS
jgi:hypothetical protein